MHININVVLEKIKWFAKNEIFDYMQSLYLRKKNPFEQVISFLNIKNIKTFGDWKELVLNDSEADILINGKKVSGLIAEVVGDGVVVGIGVNVGMKESELPVETATSLLLEGGVDLTRDQLLCEILEEFEEHFLQWDQGIDEVQPLYLHLSATVGNEVRVEYPGGKSHVAIAEAISDTGALVLDDGTHVQSADVIHLR